MPKPAVSGTASTVLRDVSASLQRIGDVREAAGDRTGALQAMKDRAAIYVEQMEGETGGTFSVLVALEYDQKTARLRLAGLTPLFPQEPILEIVRREMHQILDALEETERSQAGLAVYMANQNLNLELHGITTS